MASLSAVACSLGLLGTAVVAQQAGTLQEETHPTLYYQECSGVGACDWKKGGVTMDANWRWINKDGKNCYTDQNTWDPAVCADPATCAEQCSVEGADYEATYGITSNRYKDGVDLQFVTKGEYGTNYGSRLYLTDRDDHYKMFRLLNREFTFEVDVSTLTCGLNGALYFVEMDERGDYDGSANTAGAKYGTGYCDAQCPHDIKFIKGTANTINWQSTSDPPVGHHGACCAEMDIWEANSKATAYTPHPCSKPGLTKCEGITCGDNDADQRYDGICDKDGCDYNNYRLGEHNFYGPGRGFDVDTSRPFTVVTQFLTDDGTDTGALSEIKRFYVQDGRRIDNSAATVLGASAGDSVTDALCVAQKEKFSDLNDFSKKGGLEKMGEALGRGMVLVLSLWDDSQVNMLWLDSQYPPEKIGEPGTARGPCSGRDNTPEHLRATVPNAKVSFSQIKVGALDSTYKVARHLAADVIV
jgi:cellulose 1,4-beta-cellobiosidase